MSGPSASTHRLPLILLCLAATVGCSYDGDLDALLERSREEHRRLEAEVAELFASDLGSLQRPNGFVYAVDVGQLLDYAALAKREDWYLHVRQIALDQLRLRRRQEPRLCVFTQPFLDRLALIDSPQRDWPRWATPL